MTISEFSPRELMVVAAAREIRDGERVFVGMRLPMLAFQVAKAFHAPHAMSVFEAGIMRDSQAGGPIQTMCDLPNLTEAVWCTGLLQVMGILQRGEIDVGLIGGAQIDGYGNINTSFLWEGGRRVALTGSGGACDVACLAKRTVIIMPMEPRRFVEKVHYITSPGYGTGKNWRKSMGLRGGGPSTLVTDKAVFKFDSDGRMFLHSLHPGVRIDDIRRTIPFSFEVAPDIQTTEPPRRDELAYLRSLDPERFWLR